MATQALLKIIEIVNELENQDSKEEELLQLLKNSVHDVELAILLVGGLTKQYRLQVKPILLEFLNFVKNYKNLTEEKKIALYKGMLIQFSPPTAIVEEPHLMTTVCLSDIYEKKGDIQKALDLQKTIHFDPDIFIPNEKILLRFKLYIKIARNLAKLGQIEEAKEYIFQIDPILTRLRENPKYNTLRRSALKIMIKILTLLGKWHDAATKIFYLNNEEFDMDVLKYTLFSPYGHLKSNLIREIKESSRMMEKIKQTPLCPVFKKVSTLQIIYSQEYQEALNYILEDSEMPSKNPITSSQDMEMNAGMDMDSEDADEADEMDEIDTNMHLDDIPTDKTHITQAFAQAMLESNLIALSLIYETVSVDNDAVFLGLEAKVVEDVAGDMIRSNRLKGWIDDIEKVIIFGNGPEKGLTTDLKSWNKHISGCCVILDSIVKDISLRRPDLACQVLTVDDA